MRPPELRGPRAQGWGNQPTARDRTLWPCALDSWLLYAPKAHPFWNWYAVSACSLRDVPSLPPATKETPASTHELVLWAINPFAGEPDPTWLELGEDLAPRWTKHRLTPANLVAQVENLDDVTMNVITELFVIACCWGLCSPDSDHQRRNRAALASFARTCSASTLRALQAR